MSKKLIIKTPITNASENYILNLPDKNSGEFTIATTADIEALPEPMLFKGSVGSGGTVEWENLPNSSSSNEGFTYKVITDHATDPVCKVGDTIISNGSAWVVIPSGDEPSGTVTSIGLSMPTGFTVTNSPITSNGTLTATLDSGYELLNSNTDQTIDGKKWFSSQANFQSGFNSPGYSTIYQTDIFGRITHASSGGYTQYGLTVPGTSGWTADKTIATTEDIAQVLNLGTISFNSSNEAETSEPLVVALFDALSISGSPVLVKFSTDKWTGQVSNFSMPASFAFNQTLYIRYLYGNIRVSTSASTGYQISVYHKNNSTLIIKATQIPLDSDLVHKAGNEDITGIKIFRSTSSNHPQLIFDGPYDATSATKHKIVIKDSTSQTPNLEWFLDTDVAGRGTALAVGLHGTASFDVNTGNYLMMDSGRIMIGTPVASVYPSADNSATLGDSYYRWKDIYVAGNLRDRTNSITISQICAKANDSDVIHKGTSQSSPASAETRYGNLTIDGNLTIGSGSGTTKTLSIVNGGGAHTLKMDSSGKVLRYSRTGSTAGNIDIDFPTTSGTLATTDYVDAHTFPNCPTTTNGNYILRATVNNGTVTYEWVEDNFVRIS